MNIKEPQYLMPRDIQPLECDIKKLKAENKSLKRDIQAILNYLEILQITKWPGLPEE